MPKGLPSEEKIKRATAKIGRNSELRALYPKRCQSGVVVGDEIMFVEKVWAGAFNNSRCVGERHVIGKVISESFGEKKQKHTYTIEVTESFGKTPLSPGEVILRKANNVVSVSTRRKVWKNEIERSIILKSMKEEEGQADLLRKKRLGLSCHSKT